MKSSPYANSISIKVTPPTMKKLQSRAELFDMQPIEYVEYLIGSDLSKPDSMPTFELRPKYAEFLEKQIEEHHQCKTTVITDLDKLIASL